MEPYAYSWLLVLGIVVAFADGFGIGANDVANSFSTSVGSRSLTLKQACAIAFFTEFLGSFLLGAKTTETIRGNILNVDLFAEHPELLMLGMVCALFGSATWVIFASSKGWPVSTTHSIVGAIIGVGIAAFGPEAIDWSYNGVAKIITSWFFSPLAAGLIASAIFSATKYFVLAYQDTSFQRGLVAIPIYFGLTTAINVLFLIYKGASGLNLNEVPSHVIAPIVFGITLVVSAFSYFFYAQWLRRRILGNEKGLKWYHIFIIPFIGPHNENDYENNVTLSGTSGISEKSSKFSNNDTTDIIIETSSSSDDTKKKNIFQNIFSRIKKFVQYGLSKEVAGYKADIDQEMHDVATKYDPDTEKLYSFLQVITAAFASFAHGSNDVSNAVGPLATIVLIYGSGSVDPSGKSPVPIWIMAMGGASIDIGLIFYGFHVMRSLGNRITYHSPSRGFSMELGTSLTILTASKIGLPVSTTHCITGATACVGLCNGKWQALNWNLLAWCFFSWILTLPAAGGIAGLIFAFVSNAPKFNPI
ncbi:11891_t:CDS:2 [Funneliformis geosporum]|uniref:Phosphate transporter n=1 Tax=Funneliformis geosporum TaxID=1117311 RepID=A0A9W4SW02_9GLOM|nr:11891_t:CDS:2 [Funneliformis geosporum]CAI2182908.1 13185_t:CDS:2 [Funneliformis geosporum]